MRGEGHMTNIPLPQHRLDKSFIKVTILGELIENIIILLVLGILLYLHYFFDWKVWIGWTLIGIIIITIVTSIWSIIFRPFLLYRNTRYEVDEEFLQIKSGALFEKHELIPMTKIQSVETKQGPMMRKYNLYGISVTTMGDTHSIAGLSKSRAMEVKSLIARYAKIKEVEM